MYWLGPVSDCGFCHDVFQLREEFDRGIDVVLDEEHSIHDVAALLKEFLRDMPDPLLTRELYTPFINTLCELYSILIYQFSNAYLFEFFHLHYHVLSFCAFNTLSLICLKYLYSINLLSSSLCFRIV